MLFPNPMRSRLWINGRKSASVETLVEFTSEDEDEETDAALIIGRVRREEEELSASPNVVVIASIRFKSHAAPLSC